MMMMMMVMMMMMMMVVMMMMMMMMMRRLSSLRVRAKPRHFPYIYNIHIYISQLLLAYKSAQLHPPRFEVEILSGGVANVPLPLGVAET